MVKKLLTYGTPKRLFVSGSPKKLTAGEAGCECCPWCGTCNFSSAYLLLVVSGITNRDCSDCASLDGNFLLSFQGYNPSENYCWWEYTYPSPICGETGWRLTLAGTYSVVYTIPYARGYYYMYTDCLLGTYNIYTWGTKCYFPGTVNLSIP